MRSISCSMRARAVSQPTTVVDLTGAEAVSSRKGKGDIAAFGFWPRASALR